MQLPNRLVINTNLHLISHHFRIIAEIRPIGQIFASDRW